MRFFDWFDVPRVALSNEDTLEETHEILFDILVALAALHVLGATKHWIVSRRSRSGPRTAS